MSVKVEIFSGFLGAGKTQLIKKLIQENYYKDRIAIIENEFGEVSIDGEILKRTNTMVKEINAGCICCQVTGDFKQSIIDIIENYDVDRLIVEPTGVAKLSDIKKVFDDKELKDIVEINKLITIVDSEKFDVYLCNFKKFFINQIKSADIIVLSRTQNLKSNDLLKVQQEIKKIQPNAKIVSNEWSRTKAEDLIPYGYSTSIDSEKGSILMKKGNSYKSGAIRREKDNDNLFESFVLKIDRNVSKEELVNKFNFINGNLEFGQIVRAKGIVNTKNGKEQFDYTLSEINMQKIAYKGEGIISFIGTNLNKDKIEKIFI